jgi:hypothetical protein
MASLKLGELTQVLVGKYFIRGVHMLIEASSTCTSPSRKTSIFCGFDLSRNYSLVQNKFPEASVEGGDIDKNLLDISSGPKIVTPVKRH